MQFNDLLNNNKEFNIERMTYQGNVSMSSSHYHSHYEILYIESGSRTISVNEAKEVELNQNNISLLPPNIVHATKSNSPSQCRVLINISQKLIDEIISFTSGNTISCFDATVLPLTPYDIRTIKSDIQKLIFLQNEANVALRNEKIKITTASLLMTLSDIYFGVYNNNTALEEIEKNLNMDSIIKYIATHYYEEITLDDLAKKILMSKQHFIRTFTEKYQTTPIKYLNVFRIVTAQRLLESNTMNVSEVLKSCGFNSSVHFSRVFKQITGMSPKAYQLKFKEKKK